MKARLLPAVFSFCCLFAFAAAHAESDVPIPLIGGGKAYRRVTSWREMRDENVVKQAYDYSCGSGALATLINILFDESVDEEEIINLIVEDKSDADFEEIKKRGYPLADLRMAAEKMGYTKTVILKLHPSQLYKLKQPVLIYFEPDGERHFAVFKYIKGDRVYLADPARGNIRLSVKIFRMEWDGIVMSIDK